MHEVFAYGVIASSVLVELENGFPSEAGYAEIARIHPSFGGEAAAGAYVLARLGIATKLSGNRLGRDPDSMRVVELLSEEGVDCSTIATDLSDPVSEVVFSGNGERTVFGTYSRMLSDRAWSRPSRTDVTSSRVVCLDPFFGQTSDQVGRWCLEASIPYVTIDTPPASELARHADALIISEEFASRTIDADDPRDVLAAYTPSRGGLVILTRGSKPLLFSRGDAAVQEFAPITVDARDTTGAGDGFRAGIIYGMLRGYDDPRLIETASAVSAMVCQHIPGVVHSPTEDELDRFLDDHPRRPIGDSPDARDDQLPTRFADGGLDEP